MPCILEDERRATERAALDNEIKLGDIALIDDDNEEIFSGSKKKVDVRTPQCAALYYLGNLLHSDASVLCQSMDKLDQYLKACKDAIRAGVPGIYLHVVISQDATSNLTILLLLGYYHYQYISYIVLRMFSHDFVKTLLVADVGCFVCSIMYAFFLSETRKNSQSCTVPVISMKRADLSTHAELKWLVKSCGMDESNLIFIDEVLYIFTYLITDGSLHSKYFTFVESKTHPVFKLKKKMA